MTPPDPLARLGALLEKATKAPWISYNARATQNGTPVLTVSSIAKAPESVHDGEWVADVRYEEHSTADATLIVALRNLAPALVAVARAADAYVNLPPRLSPTDIMDRGDALRTALASLSKEAT